MRVIHCLFLFLICVSLNLFGQQEIKVCSFNIKFVGLYKKKDNQSLAALMAPYDIVLVQELVSPPRAGLYPDGTPYEADEEARAFVDAMLDHGFDYLLSSEDTGTGDQIHMNSSATEWFVAFYKPHSVSLDTSLFTDFLADDRSNHPSYERVPYAFSFRSNDGGFDFTLISVHLQPGAGSADKARRAEELAAIEDWICVNNQQEEDFLIVGDMNIYSQGELYDVLPDGYRSLNDACVSTTMAKEVRPYDHVMYAVGATGHQIKDEFIVINLIAAMEPMWSGTTPYPSDDMNLFNQYYSDHHPVVFTLVSDGRDDD